MDQQRAREVRPDLSAPASLRAVQLSSVVVHRQAVCAKTTRTASRDAFFLALLKQKMCMDFIFLSVASHGPLFDWWHLKTTLAIPMIKYVLTLRKNLFSSMQSKVIAPLASYSNNCVVRAVVQACLCRRILIRTVCTRSLTYMCMWLDTGHRQTLVASWQML